MRRMIRVILPIRKEGDPVLRRVAAPVERIDKKIKKLIGDMLETMYDVDGVGLAAPQVGQSIRLIVMDAGEGPIVMINPKIIEATGEEADYEGCLSIPGVTGKVKRHQEVRVEGFNASGKKVTMKANGLLARAFQHEIDHLDGILFTDKATDITR